MNRLVLAQVIDSFNYKAFLLVTETIRGLLYVFRRIEEIGHRNKALSLYTVNAEVKYAIRYTEVGLLEFLEGELCVLWNFCAK